MERAVDRKNCIISLKMYFLPDKTIDLRYQPSFPPHMHLAPRYSGSTPCVRSCDCEYDQVIPVQLSLDRAGQR
jgi:hypothetical protein